MFSYHIDFILNIILQKLSQTINIFITLSTTVFVKNPSDQKNGGKITLRPVMFSVLKWTLITAEPIEWLDEPITDDLKYIIYMVSILSTHTDNITDFESHIPT